MAVFELGVGKQLDILTPDDLRGIIAGWQVEAVRGYKSRRFGATGGADSTGKVTVGGATNPLSGQLGPTQGFAWSVRRLSVRIDGNPNVAWSLYVGAENENAVVADVPATAFGLIQFQPGALVLKEGEQLVAVASGFTSTSRIVLSGHAVEAPIQLAWRLLT